MRLQPFQKFAPIPHLILVMLGSILSLAAGCGDDASHDPIREPDAATPTANPAQDGSTAGETEVGLQPDVTIVTIDSSSGPEGGSQRDSGLEGGGTAIDVQRPYESENCMTAPTLRRTVNLDDVTLGHSARDVAKEFAKNGTGLLQWFDGATTAINITADISQATVTIDDYPPFQGYCDRSLILTGVSFTITTDDGRLQETVVTSVYAEDAGGPILSIWPSPLMVDLTQLRGSLQLPADWSSPAMDNQDLEFNINARANIQSPYCHSGETPDLTPPSDCTAHGGSIVYSGISSLAHAVTRKLAGLWDWQ